MYNILDFGAQRNCLCTASIQTAIDECFKNGGGRVIIPSGVFITGTIYIKDNVEIYLETGAVLKASECLNDYNADDAYVQNWGSEREGWRAKHMIIALECTNVAISGNGTVDGSAQAFFGDEKVFPGGYAWENGYINSRDSEKLRPGQLICFIECSNIRVSDITIQNSPCWSCFFHGCEFVQVRGIKIKNPDTYVNTDGLDIDCCRYVTVSDCIINTGDDAIAIRCAETKLKKSKACEYITITNCILSSSSSAFRIGVGFGKIRHVMITGCTVAHAGALITYTTAYRGIGDANIEDVTFSDISANNVGLGMDCVVSKGCVKNVTMQNMRISSKAGLYALAAELGNISCMTIRNVELTVLENKIKQEKYIVNVENADNVLLEEIRVYSDFRTWDNSYADAGCKNLIIRNCVFP